MMTKPVTESLEPYTFVYEDRGPSCNNAQPRSTKGLKKATTATTIQQQVSHKHLYKKLSVV